MFLPNAGNLSFENSAILSCSESWQLVNMHGSSFGRAAFLREYPYPWDRCGFLTSTFEASCESCPFEMYTLASGELRGGAGSVLFPGCIRCPFGGVCQGPSVIVPELGYWGNVTLNGSVSFRLCPAGYCCTSSDDASCAAMDSCYANRTGPLCGDCLPGFSESVSSTACVPNSRCGNDVALFWSMAVVGIFIDAFLQLLLVSDLLPDARQAFGRSFRCLARRFVCVFKRACRTCSRRSQPVTAVDTITVADSESLPASDSQSQPNSSAATGDAKFKVFSYFTQVEMCPRLLS